MIITILRKAPLEHLFMLDLPTTVLQLHKLFICYVNRKNFIRTSPLLNQIDCLSISFLLGSIPLVVFAFILGSTNNFNLIITITNRLIRKLVGWPVCMGWCFYSNQNCINQNTIQKKAALLCFLRTIESNVCCH